MRMRWWRMCRAEAEVVRGSGPISVALLPTVDVLPVVSSGEMTLVRGLCEGFGTVGDGAVLKSVSGGVAAVGML